MEIQKTIHNVNYNFYISFDVKDHQYVIGNIEVNKNVENFRKLENSSEILKSILHKALHENFHARFYIKTSNIDTGEQFIGLFQKIISNGENSIEIPVKLETSNTVINVKLQLLEDFIECTKLEKSPFNHVQNFYTNSSESLAFFEKIVIKADITEDQRLPIVTNYLEDSYKTIEKAINKFLENYDSYNSYQIIETLTCNKFEQQVKFIVMPREAE